jgi:hypothetical protein
MAQVEIFRRAEDGLSRQKWGFHLRVPHSGDATVQIALVFYGVERRKTARGVFSKAVVKERWWATDERQYMSGLPRPTEIPDDVLAEAKASLTFEIYFGFYNETCRYAG